MTPHFKAFILITFLGLTGCAEYSAFKSGVANHGADVSDEIVDTSLWTICNAAPVGSINRKFKTEEEREAYRAICPGNVLP